MAAARSTSRAACLLALLLCVAVLVGGAQARRRHHHRKLHASSSSNRQANFDFFFLVRQWPASFCNEHYCAHRPPKSFEFTVHGMWPQRRDGTWPEFCDPSSHLDPQQLDDIYDDMEHDWPSWSGPDESFWDHEWNRHGTCAAPVTGDQHRFFKTVLSLHERYSIQAALSRAGILPSNSRRYPVQDIKDAIEQMYGVMPHVTCDQKGELAEVWMCVNKRLKMIDCVEDPRLRSKAAAASNHQQQQQHAGDSDELTAAPVPPNYNCNMVIIPKLQKHWGKHPGLDAVGSDAVVAAASASAVEQTAAAAAVAVGAADPAATTTSTSVVVVTEAAGEDAVVQHVAVAGVAPEPVVAAAATSGRVQLRGAAAPNQHLPLLAGVVVGVVAAAVVAAAVALRAQPALQGNDGCASCCSKQGRRSRGSYVPPALALSEPAAVEHAPLCAVPSSSV